MRVVDMSEIQIKLDMFGDQLCDMRERLGIIVNGVEGSVLSDDQYVRLNKVYVDLVNVGIALGRVI